MRRTLILALGSALLLAGCEACTAPPGGNEPDALPIEPDGNPPNPEPEPEPDVPADTRALEYEGTTPLTLTFGDEVDLTFRVTEDGAPVAGARVSLTAQGDAGTLNAANVDTDADGRATVTFRAADEAGQVTLTATTSGAPETPQVTIAVGQEPIGDLRVSLSSAARIEVVRADALVFASAQGSPPSCDELAALETLPTAEYSIDDVSPLPNNRTLTDIRHDTRVTVLASGYSAEDAIVASGCVDGVITEGGRVSEAAVIMQQLPSLLAGDYDVLMHMDIGNTLPSPYDTYITTTANILADPVGFVVYQALRAADQNAGTSFVTWGQGEAPEGGPARLATFEEIRDDYIASGGPSGTPTFGTWATAKEQLEQLVVNQLGFAEYQSITTVGGDLEDLVTDFEVGARLSLSETTNPDVYDIVEKWNALVFEWSMGCPEPVTAACRRRPVLVTGTEFTAVDTTYSALAEADPQPALTERFRFASDPHSVSLRYGAVLLTAMNEVVFPNLPAGVAGNSLQDVLDNIINCASVGQTVEDVTGGLLSQAQGENFCENGVDALGDYVVGTVLDLEVGGGDPELGPKEQNGVLSGGTFYLLDEDVDLAAERLVDFEYVMGWNDPADPEYFEDISAPITGDGRLAASDCGTDLDCDDGRACHPIPHYLKVARAEFDCRPAVGATAGEGGCSADEDCASGVCLGDGSCFAACTDAGACDAMYCDVIDDVLDGEPVLTGLGGIGARGCTDVAPTGNGLCEDTCGPPDGSYIGDGACDDGGPNSDFSVCALGTDCTDCGPR